MAISSYKAFLMKGTGTGTLTYAKLVDVKSVPDLGGEPELLETTTLSDGMQTYIPGIQQIDSMDFLCNYTLADYTTLKALEDTELHLAVWFGATVSNGVATPTGSDGKFEFDGKITVYVEGAGVNEVVNMHVIVAPSSIIKQTATA